MRKLNKEEVETNIKKEEKNMKNNRKSLILLVSALIISMLTACNGETSPATTTPTTPDTTVVAEPTKAPEAPTEAVADPTPTEVLKEDLIIDGINITEFNEKDAPITNFLTALSYDEPKIIIAKDVEDFNEQDIFAIVSFGDHFVGPKNAIYYVYSPNEISSIHGDYVEEFAFTIDSVKANGFRLNGIGNEEVQIDLNIYYEDNQYNETVNGTRYTIYVKEGDTIEQTSTTTTETTETAKDEVKADDLIIDGINISQINREGVNVFDFVKNLGYDEPKLVALKGGPGSEDEQEILGIISMDEHYTEPAGVNVRYIPYSPNDIKTILLTDESISYEPFNIKLGEDFLTVYMLDAAVEEGEKDVPVNVTFLLGEGKSEAFQFFVSK